MDGTQNTRKSWRSLTEMTGYEATVMVALISIAGYAMWTMMCVWLTLAGAL